MPGMQLCIDAIHMESSLGRTCSSLQIQHVKADSLQSNNTCATSPALLPSEEAFDNNYW